MNKLLVDTNVLVYGIDEDSQFFHQSRNILNSSNQLVTTSKNLLEFLAVVTRGTGYSLNTETALEILNDFIGSFTIIYPSRESFAIFLELMEEYKPKGLKVHDFEIISIALSKGINQIATFNVSDFRSVKEISLVDL